MQASVLIVDDEPSVRQTLSEWVRKKNFHVFEAEGGQQAMEMIRRDDRILSSPMWSCQGWTEFSS
jgi:DNA-binding NtrC family response regulator